MKKEMTDEEAVITFVVIVLIGIGLGITGLVHHYRYHHNPEFRAQVDKEAAQKQAEEQAKKDAPKRIQELERRLRELESPSKLEEGK